MLFPSLRKILAVKIWLAQCLIFCDALLRTLKKMRRVVVTGLGLVTPLGEGVEANWQKLIAGESGVGSIKSFDTSGLSVTIGADVPIGDGLGEFNADNWL